MDSKQPDLFGQLPSASETSSAKPSSESTGPASRSTKTLGPFWPTPNAFGDTKETPEAWVERNAKKKKENPNLGELHLSLGTAVRMAEESALQMDLEESTSSAADSPVSPGVSRGSSEAQKMTAISGRRWLPLLKSYGLNGSLARMSEALLTSRWASSAAFLTWKASGIKPSHLLFQLAPSMPRTDEIESGLLPTPDTQMRDNTKVDYNAGAESMPGRSLPVFVRTYPQTGMWPTPTTPSGGGERSGDRAGTGDLHYMARAGELWPTPRSCSAMAAENIQNRVNDKFPNLESVVAQTSADQRSRLGGSLNPQWVEWLMGFPTGWTDLEVSEMPSSPRSSSKSEEQ